MMSLSACPPCRLTDPAKPDRERNDAVGSYTTLRGTIMLTHPEAVRLALERAHGGHWLPQELQARRDTLRHGQASLQRQVERLTEAYLAGVVGLAEYQRRRHDLEQREQALAGQEHQLEAQADRQLEIARVGLSIEQFCQRVGQGLQQANWEQKQQLIEWLVARVIVTNG